MITNLKNGKVYVGQTTKGVGTRFSQHLHVALKLNVNTPLYKAIRKYGPENWALSVLEKCSSKEELNNRELFWIEEARKLTIAYNLTAPQSLRSRLWTEEEKKTRHLPIKPEKIKCLNDGLIHSSIRSAALFYGLKETSLSAVLTGKKDSIKKLNFEYLDLNKKRKSISVKSKRKYNSITRHSIGIKIVNLDTNETFSSINRAAKAMGLSPSTVGRFLKEGHGKCKNVKLRYLEA